MCVLVYITLQAGVAYSTVVDLPGTMTECFKMREMLSQQVGKDNGYFKAGSQAVCIQVEGEPL